MPKGAPRRPSNSNSNNSAFGGWRLVAPAILLGLCAIALRLLHGTGAVGHEDITLGGEGFFKATHAAGCERARTSGLDQPC